MIVCIISPLIAGVIAFREVSYTTPTGQRLAFYRVISQIWREGVGLMLSGVGLSGPTASRRSSDERLPRRALV